MAQENQRVQENAVEAIVTLVRTGSQEDEDTVCEYNPIQVFSIRNMLLFEIWGFRVYYFKEGVQG